MLPTSFLLPRSSAIIFVVSLQTLVLCLYTVQARPVDYEYSCNICRDPPSGKREVTNPSKSFTQESNGVTMTCGELQASVQDLDPISGAPGEARLCVTAQYLAWLHCDCMGPSIPPPTDNYKDPNPACDLCAGRDFNFVPEPNFSKLTNTGCCGNMNCQVLYQGAAEGVLSPSMCGTIQQKSGGDCCNLESIIRPPTPPPIQERDRDVCLEVQASCNMDGRSLPCCAGLECRNRSVYGDPICSTVSKNTKERIGGETPGGANRGTRNRSGVRGEGV